MISSTKPWLRNPSFRVAGECTDHCPGQHLCGPPDHVSPTPTSKKNGSRTASRAKKPPRLALRAEEPCLPVASAAFLKGAFHGCTVEGGLGLLTRQCLVVVVWLCYVFSRILGSEFLAGSSGRNGPHAFCSLEILFDESKLRDLVLGVGLGRPASRHEQPVLGGDHPALH